MFREGFFFQEGGRQSARTETTRIWLGHREYWLCQLGGWGSFALLNTAEALMQAPAEGAQVAGAFLIGVIGLLATHGYRWLILRGNWKLLPWFRLLRNVVGFSLSLSAAIVLPIQIVAPMYWEPEGAEQLAESWSRLPFAIVWVSIIFIIWSALYFAYHYYQQIQQARLVQVRQEMMIKESALSALRAQVNPHFLFNSLNMLRGLIHENPEKAADAVTRLATLLRASLQAGQEHFVSLGEEMETVRAYLEIERCRLEERLQVRIWVAEELGSFRFPPYLLQNLVENAVKYGPASQRGEGCVAVLGRRSAGGLLIRVINNGQIASGSRSTGLGLLNSRERIRLLYGEQARLDLRNHGQRWVVATLFLPQDEAMP